MVAGVTKLVYCGCIDLKPSLQLLSNPYQNPNFRLPLPLGNGKSVRNNMAFHVLHSIFLKAETELLRGIIIGYMFKILGDDPANYFITEPMHSIAMFIGVLDTLPPALRRQVFKLLEFVVLNLNFVPFPELASLSIQLKSTVPDVMSLCFGALMKFVAYDTKYRDICRAVGIMDALVANIMEYDGGTKEGGDEPDGTEVARPCREALPLLCQCIASVIATNPANAELLRVAGGSHALFRLVGVEWAADSALHLIQQLILDRSRDAGDDLSMLLEKLQSVAPTQYVIKIAIMNTFLRLFKQDSRTKADFFEAQGFVYVICSLLQLRETTTLGASFPEGTPESDALCQKLLEHTFEVMATSLHESRVNQAAVREERSYEMLRDTVRSAELMSSKHVIALFDCVFHMSAETFGRDINWDDMSTQPPPIVNAEVLGAFIPLLPSSPRHAATYLKRLRIILRSPSNAQVCSEASMVQILLDHFGSALMAPDAEFHEDLLEIVTRLGQFNVSRSELWKMLRLQAGPEGVGGKVPELVIKTLAAMACDMYQDQSASFIEFDMSGTGHMCVFVPTIGKIKENPTSPIPSFTERPWPYAGGMSVALWFRVVQYGMDSHPVRLASILTPTAKGDKIHAAVAIDPQDLTLNISCGDKVLPFPSHTFSPGQWTHLTVQFGRSKAKGMPLKVYVNGELMIECKQEIKLPAFSASKVDGQLASDLICMRLGTGYSNALKSTLAWRLGPCLVFSDQLSDTAVAAIHQLGPSYSGNLQGSLASFQPWCCSPAPLEFVSGRRGQTFNGFLGKTLIPNGMLDLRKVAAPLIADRSLVLALHANSVTEAKDTQALEPLGGRAAYKLFRRELGLPDGSTSTRAFRNRAPDGPVFGHLMNGVRMSVSQPLHSVLDQVGGMSIVLKLVDDSDSAEYLQHAIELFVLMVTQSSRNAREVEHINGYAILGGLLSRKSALLTRGTLDLLLSLTWPDQQLGSGTPRALARRNSSSGPGRGGFAGLGLRNTSGLTKPALSSPSKKDSIKSNSSGHSGTAQLVTGIPTITNAVAFRELVLAYEVYREAPQGLVRLVFNHVAKLVQDGQLQAENIKVLRELEIVPTYLAILSEKNTPATVSVEIINILSKIFRVSTVPHDARQVGHLLMNTLQDSTTLPAPVDQSTLAQLTNARHMVLKTLLSLLTDEIAANESTYPSIADAFSRTLGPLYFLHFIRKPIDDRTVILVIQILVNLLHQDRGSFASKFAAAAGYTILFDGLVQYCHLPEVHLAAVSMLLGQDIVFLSPVKSLSLQIFHQHVKFDSVREAECTLRLEAFGMVVKLLSQLRDLDIEDAERDDQTDPAAAAHATPEAPDPFSSPAKPPNPFAAPAAAAPTPAPAPAAPSLNAPPLYHPEVPGNPFGPPEAAAPTGPPGNPFAKPTKPPNPFATHTPPSKAVATTPANLFAPPRPPPPAVGTQQAGGVERRWQTVFFQASLQFLEFLVYKSKKLMAAFAANPQCGARFVAVLFRVTIETGVGMNSSELISLHSEQAYNFLASLCFASLRCKGDKATAQLDAYLEAVPFVDADDLREFFTVVCHKVLKHAIDTNTLATPPPDKQSFSLANLGRFVTNLINRLTPLVSQDSGAEISLRVLRNTVTLVWEMLRQVCDENGAVHAFAMRAVGKGTLQPAIDSIVSVANRLVVLLLQEAQAAYQGNRAHDEDGIGPRPAPRQQAVDAYRFVAKLCEFYLGQMNNESGVVPCICRMLASWSFEGHSDRPMKDAVAQLLRVVVIRRPNQVISLMKIRIDSTMGRTADDAKLLGLLAKGKAQLTETSAKHWLSFESNVAASKNSSDNLLKKRTNGILKEQKEAPSRKGLLVAFRSKSSNRVARTVALEGRRTQDRRHRLIDHRRFITAMWTNLDSDLHRELGVFGPSETSHLDKWDLAVLEGPSRMRKLLQPNPNFYLKYKPEPTSDAQASPSKSPRRPVSKHAGEYQFVTGRPESKGAGPWTVRSQKQIWTGFDEISSAGEGPVASGGEEETAAKDEGADDDDGREDYIVQQILGAEDKRLWEVEAARATGLDANDGVFIFCEKTAYFAESYGIKKVTPTTQRLFRRPQHGADQNQRRSDMVTKWGFEQIRDLRRRRYCLQDVALELFSDDGVNTMLVFNDRTDRDSVYDTLIAASSTLITTAKESVDGMQRDAKLERDGLFSGLVGGRTVTQRWESGELSNFEYIMHLNTLAGRSYNDLNQYPVFPWILKDYDSTELDLNDPAIYRDFTKPMGAQTPKRAESFRERYDMWEDPTGDEQPAFHYGTHYSSAQYVAGYLIRLEPFTQQFINLQGGQFDHPDRMFHSIKENWQSASELSNGDVKELIPEFFYLPEFLTNSNGFVFGKKQNGVSLDSVLLPTWAKGSPDEFVRIHRAALESKHVSANLHHWIDLIFGHKQRGEEAVKALNVFHHLTYEGAVDIDSIDDPMKKAATISFINNFGQTPSQLFKRAHPSRRSIAGPADDKNTICLSHAPEQLLTSAQPFKETGHAVGSLLPDKSGVLVGGSKQALIPPYYNRNLSWEWYGQSLVSSASSGVTSMESSTVYEGLHRDNITCATVLSSKMVITGGADGTVRAWKIQPGLKSSNRGLVLQRTLCGHQGGITCLEVVPTYSLLVTGSESGECIVWGDLSSLDFIRKLSHPQGPIRDIAGCGHSGNMLTCDPANLMLWSVNGKLLAKRETPPNKPAEVMSTCAVSPLADWTGEQIFVTGNLDASIMVWAARARTPPAEAGYELQLLCKLQSPEKDGHALSRVTCLRFTPDATKLFAGHANGNVYSWGLANQSGKVAEHWIRDNQANLCMGASCSVKFSFSERKHHCRKCGKVFCSKCSSNEAEIPVLKITKPVRVCDTCFDELMGAISVPSYVDEDGYG